MNINKKTLSLSSNLKCTEKALAQIQSYSQSLSGRERQFLFLMMRDDDLSLRALDRFIDKVNIPSLIQRGYLAIKEGGSIDEYVDDVRVVKSDTSYVAPVALDNVLPSVALLSGNFG